MKRSAHKWIANLQCEIYVSPGLAGLENDDRGIMETTRINPIRPDTGKS